MSIGIILSVARNVEQLEGKQAMVEAEAPAETESKTDEEQPDDGTTNPTYKPYRFIIAGGGTGGHIFPAVGDRPYVKNGPGIRIPVHRCQRKMEMEKVPQAGFAIRV